MHLFNIPRREEKLVRETVEALRRKDAEIIQQDKQFTK